MQAFVTAKFHDVQETIVAICFRSKRERLVDDGLAGDVFNLTATKRKVFCQLHRLFISERWDKRLPDMAALLGSRFGELDLVDESAFEGGVKVGGKVGCGDEDAVEAFHLLEDDVLHGILHLVNALRAVVRRVKSASASLNRSTGITSDSLTTCR